MTRLSDEDSTDIIEKLRKFYEEHLHHLFVGGSKLNRTQSSSKRGYFLLILALSNGTPAGEHINLKVEWMLKAVKETIDHRKSCDQDKISKMTTISVEKIR